MKKQTSTMTRKPRKNPASAPVEANRRRAVRRQPTVGTICRLDGAHGKKKSIGLVWNISTSGVSMLLSEPVDAGSTVEAQLATTDDRVSLPVTLEVAHVSKLVTGDYIMGGQFSRPLKMGEMRPFLAVK